MASISRRQYSAERIITKGQDMSNDWYLYEYKNKDYLHKKKLLYKSFDGSKETHDHCELCWARFSIYPCDLQRGYYEPLSKSWICPDCFNELAALFEWT